jgi:predicted ABC-class ATPase
MIASPEHEAGAVTGGGTPDPAADRDLTFFDPPAIDRVLAMVMELAKQLNEERYRRLALEHALIRGGVVSATELEAMTGDAGFAAEARDRLDRAVVKLVEPIVADGHPWRPLRGQAPDARQRKAPHDRPHIGG